MTTTSKQTIRRNWEAWPSTIEVPPSEWRWGFDLKMGEPRALNQQFIHKRDDEGVSMRRNTVGPVENPHNWPIVTFDLVKKMCDESQYEQRSLRKCFLNNYDRRKLSDEQIEMLSMAPDIYIAGPLPEQIRAGEAERTAHAQAFLAEVDAEKKAKAPKAQARETVKV